MEVVISISTESNEIVKQHYVDEGDVAMRSTQILGKIYFR